jgi:hypothetical protein
MMEGVRLTECNTEIFVWNHVLHNDGCDDLAPSDGEAGKE